MSGLKITDKVAGLPDGSKYFSLEFFPPKTQAGTANLLPRLQRLAAFQPLFVTVTWGAGGSTATKSLDLAEICAAQFGLTVCLHLTCTNSSKAVIDEALTRCKELGIRNILALRGDEPRNEEYALDADKRAGGQPGEGVHGDERQDGEEEVQFVWARDLVKYIRKKHGDYFCIGVAAYPEGWAASQNAPTRSPEHDMPYLVEKTQAGADFVMTQLFYDVEQFLHFERMLRTHESGVFKDMPIVPGLMPVQSWGILTRTTKLTSCHVPADILERFTKVKSDDDEIKKVGVDVLEEMVSRIQEQHRNDDKAPPPGEPKARRPPQAFHFYTLNLEKAVAQILKRTNLVPEAALTEESDTEVAVEDAPPLSNGTTNGKHLTKDRHRLSSTTASDTNNRVVVTRPSEGSLNAKFEALDTDAGIPTPKKTSRRNTMAIAEGEGTLGREATWDDYPNGRWGDARSPAFGSIDGYGPSLHVSHAEAIQLWGRPTSTTQITDIFRRYLNGTMAQVPWSEEALSSETGLISKQLLAMTERGWWSVASQPAVDGARSDDDVVGWGPRVGGHVWQKPFVEFFLPQSDWEVLRARLDQFKSKVEAEDGVTYYAGDAKGSFTASEPDSVNPVTWGCFKGKEIITPTIIESESFRAWQDEAFGIWREWQRVYPAGSPSSKLIESVWKDLVLVNVIGHQYQDGGRLWDLLLEDGDQKSGSQGA